jgi:SAM-dependent methyltransferase
VPRLHRDELAQRRGAFDVVTAIEVLEHALDPVAELREIADLLAPSGVLFLTTGNAAPFRSRLLKWQYVQPDVHVGYFEPETLARALSTAGLEPEHAGYVPGFTELIRAKVLRTLGVGRRNVAERLVPWSLVSRVANRRYGVSAHPLGRKPGLSSPPSAS